MMINCPNCNLLQPKDQYCAQCGINMETWRPPQEPGWKKLASNWMVQLAVLFSIVFALVLKDSFSSKSNNDYQESSLPVASSIPRDESASFTESRSSENIQNQDEPPKIKAQANSPVPETNEAQAEEEIADLQKRAAVKVTVMSRAVIDKIAEKSQKLEENFFLINKADLVEITRQNNKEMKSIGSQRKIFEFSQDALFFVGEEDLDTGLKLGFFMQINVNESSNQQLLKYQVNTWDQLQLSGEPGPRTSLEVKSPYRSLLVVVDPSVHDVSFSPEEKTLFESSNRLNHLVRDSFRPDQGDIVLVLEMK